MSCITMSKFDSVVFCRAENVISAHSSTGLIKSMILDILMLGYEISAKITTLSM